MKRLACALAVVMIFVPCAVFADASMASEAPSPYEAIAENEPSMESTAPTEVIEEQDAEAPVEEVLPNEGDIKPEELSGEAQFKTAEELYQYWMAQNTDYYAEYPYPDYVCGVWSTDGGSRNLTFAVTKNEEGEAGKEEILRLIEDDSTVTFTYQTYSYKELWDVRMELEPRMGEETGAIGMGIYEMDNVLHIDIDEKNPNGEYFMKECFERFGNKVAFKVGEIADDLITVEEGGFIDAGGSGMAGKAWVWGMAALAVAAAVLLVIFRQRIFVHAGTNAAALSVGSMTKGEVEQAVKDANVSPSEELEQRIKKRLQQDK